MAADESELRYRAAAGSLLNDQDAEYVKADEKELKHAESTDREDKAGSASQTEDEEDDDKIEQKLEGLTKTLPQASDHTTEVIDSALAGFSARWRNWIIRGIFTWVMISGFCAIVYLGPLALMCLVFAIQIKCFKEIIDIGYVVYRVHNLPWFRSLSWWFLLTSDYFFCGESFIEYFGVLLHKDEFGRFLIVHHRLISFALYILGFVWFVLSLVKRYYLRQFSLFAWTHVTLLLIVGQSYLIINNIFEGMIWFLVPVSMIICNDIMAYMFGFFFGRTPLIQLSPKKTWEGFIGGAVSTIIFALGLSYVLLHFPWFICPLEHYGDSFTNCKIPSTFQLQEYNVPTAPMRTVFKLLRRPLKLKIYPFMFHTLAMGLFSSLVGPFGGFFASGFKRAFKIKDFGAVIPGHGGLMDRFDCQLLMGTFVYVWISTFIRIPTPAKIVQQIMFLQPDEQLELYNLLTERLLLHGVLPNVTDSMSLPTI